MADYSEPLIAFATCDLIPVNTQMTLAINRENGKQALLSGQVVEALKTCTQFATAQEHTTRLCLTRPELKGQDQTVLTALNQLRDSGLLLEARQVCERINQGAPRSLPNTRICVITSDRPQTVDRLLQSMLATGGLSKHDALFLVDDSKLPENQAANREAVESFNTTSAKDMVYFGPGEQHALIQFLITAIPDHEAAVRFLIDPDEWHGKPTYGRSRTLALLLTVGFRAIVLDDDILCQAVRPAVPEDGVFVGSGGLREASFFANTDTLMAAAALHEESPLDLHARYLGETLGQTLQGIKGEALAEADLKGANAAMTNIWRANSPVLVTQCGSWGDPGTGDAHWTLRMSEYSISRLLTAEGGVSHAIEERCAWLGSPRPTIMKMAFMSQMTGLDNSALLPPYFPAFRGEDLLFASMVEATHPRGAVLDCDFAVPHLPEMRQRKTLRDPIANAGSVALFSAYLTNRIDYTDGNEAPHRLALIAEDLRRLSDKPTHELLMDYRREVATSHAQTLHMLVTQRQRTADMNSATWAGYLDRGLEELQGALQREWSPTDIEGAPAGASAESMIDTFKTYLAGFASALEAWPAIRDQARDFKVH